jgi:uncharacterized protein YidB (DUF937 family)
MAQPTPSVFDSLVEAGAPPVADAAVAEWLVRRLLEQGPANGLQQLVDDLNRHGMQPQLEAWLAGRAQPLAPTEVAALTHDRGVLDPASIDTFATAVNTNKDAVQAKLGELIPGVVQMLMPHGEVPAWNTLELGLNSLTRSLAAARTSQSR